MKKIITLFIGLLLSLSIYSQCTNFLAQYPAGNQTTTSPSLTTIQTCMWGGEYAVCNVTTGETYVWTTCGDIDFDTQLSLWNTAHTISYGYSDDDCFLQSTVMWTATFTGQVHILVSRYNCTYENRCMTLQWACISCGGELTVPNSGGDTIQMCGGSIYDIGGPNWNYTDNYNGYMVIEPENSTDLIEISGDLDSELDYDILFILDGANGTEPIINSYSAIAYGSSTTFNVTDEYLTFQYVPGSWEEENSYEIRINGSVVYSDGPNPTSGIVYQTYCSGLSTITINMYDTYGDGWNGGVLNVIRTDTRLLWVGSGVETINNLTSISGPITLYFISDISVNSVGFDLDISCLNTLPIELSYFSINFCENGDSGMSWETFSETNNDYFVLERSCDGHLYEVLDTIGGNGNSTEVHTYNYLDEYTCQGDNYYRLTQVDYDGCMTVYDPKYVYCDKGRGIIIYPNPTTGIIYIEYYDFAADLTKTAIYEQSGRLIYSKEMFLPIYWLEVIDISFIKSGEYLLIISSYKKLFTTKIIKL